MLLVRSKKGIILSDDVGPIHAFFVIVASPNQKNFYLHSLMWIVQVAEETDFETEWIIAKDDEELKDIILAAWKKRESI
jgi:mannitol/fructose-specific phosphotransferase system IIA component (Ntr-type)